MRNFRDLKVWQKSHQLVLDIYRETADFPAEERFGLTFQVRKSAVSVPSNIAEGCGRSSDPDFARFLDIAIGSASELEYQLLLSRDLKYLRSSIHAKLECGTTEVKRMLTSFLKKLRS